MELPTRSVNKSHVRLAFPFVLALSLSVCFEREGVRVCVLGGDCMRLCVCLCVHAIVCEHLCLCICMYACLSVFNLQ